LVVRCLAISSGQNGGSKTNQQNYQHSLFSCCFGAIFGVSTGFRGRGFAQQLVLLVVTKITNLNSK
jgi:hypothetical protein